MDWPVYLINLDKDRTRLEAATAELTRVGIPWTRIPAINGRSLPADRIAKAYDARTNRARALRPMTAPEIGCYLSHIAAWRAIVGSGAEGGVVLEDDFRISGDFSNALHALSRDGGDWDMVKLFTENPAVRRQIPRRVAPGMELAVPHEVPASMLGYVVRRNAADRLLRRAQPFYRPVGEDLKFYWERELKVSLLSPQPLGLGHNETAEGSVSDSILVIDKKDKRSGPERMIAALRYRLSYRIGLHRHRLSK